MFYGFVSLFFLQTVPLLTITFMLSCSCQVDSVLNNVTTTLGEAAIYGERDRKPESQKCFLLRTRPE